MPFRIIHGGPNAVGDALGAAGEGFSAGVGGAIRTYSLLQQLEREAQQWEMAKQDRARSIKQQDFQNQLATNQDARAAAGEVRAQTSFDMGVEDRATQNANAAEDRAYLKDQRARAGEADQANQAGIAQMAAAAGIPQEQIAEIVKMDPNLAFSIIEKRALEAQRNKQVADVTQYLDRTYAAGGFGPPQMLDQNGMPVDPSQAGPYPNPATGGNPASGAGGSAQPGIAEQRLEGMKQAMALGADPLAVMEQARQVNEGNAAQEARIADRQAFADSARQGIAPLAFKHPELYGMAATAISEYADGMIDYAELHEKLGRAQLVAETSVDMLESEFGQSPEFFLQALALRSALRDGGVSVETWVKEMRALRTGHMEAAAGAMGTQPQPGTLDMQIEPGQSISVQDFKKLVEQERIDNQSKGFDTSKSKNQSLLDLNAFRQARARGADMGKVMIELRPGKKLDYWMDKAAKEIPDDELTQEALTQKAYDLFEEWLRGEAG